MFANSFFLLIFFNVYRIEVYVYMNVRVYVKKVVRRKVY